MEKEIFIEEFNDKGDGVTYLDGATVEVVHTIPGDHVLAYLYKKRRKKIKGRLIKVLKPSDMRTLAPCCHAQICGGCSWQAFNYDDQLKQKEKMVIENFKYLIEKGNIEIFPIIGSSSIRRYRNKMEFSFSENKKGEKFLGLMIAKARRYVFNLDNCYLCSKWFTSVVNQVRKWWLKSSLSAYNYFTDEGSLRCLTLREGKYSDEKMIILTVSGNPNFAISKKEINEFERCVKDVFTDEELKKLSVFLHIHQIEKNKPTQIFEIKLFGKDYIREEIHINDIKLKFDISPSSFFQPNTHQAEKIYSKALEMIGTENDVVFDLYSGTGTLAMIFSFFAKHIVAIEQNVDAVVDAEKNMDLNNIKNLTLYQGDVGKILTTLLQQKDKIFPDVVIVDPPRAGLDTLAIEHIKTLRPKKLLYISCNPKTQAENCFELVQSKKYCIKKILPIDQFPHTIHIENIVLLEKL